MVSTLSTICPCLMEVVQIRDDCLQTHKEVILFHMHSLLAVPSPTQYSVCLLNCLDVSREGEEEGYMFVFSLLQNCWAGWSFIGWLPPTFKTRDVRLDKVCLFVGWLTSQQQASVSQGRICSDKFTCCHTEIEVADPTFYLTQSQYADTGPTSPSADPITPGAWQGSHWSANFEVTGMTRPRKNPGASGNWTRKCTDESIHCNPHPHPHPSTPPNPHPPPPPTLQTSPGADD